MATATITRWASVAGAGPSAPHRNQDRAAAIGPADAMDAVGVVVCDGVGEFAGSGDIAQLACDTAVSHIARHGACVAILGADDPEDEPVPHCARHVADTIGPTDDGATTLLAVAADARGRVAFTFVGNGMLLDVEPVPRGAGRIRVSAAQLVTPHISWAEGRPALRSVIPPRVAGAPVIAARGLLYPQPDRPRIMLALTDGIASDEERVEGTSDGTRWLQVPGPLAAIFAGIERAWPELSAADDPGAALGCTLQDALDGLPPGTLLDDATIGALLLLPEGG